jgi:hypothetical protein
VIPRAQADRRPTHSKRGSFASPRSNGTAQCLQETIGKGIASLSADKDQQRLLPRGESRLPREVDRFPIRNRRDADVVSFNASAYFSIAELCERIGGSDRLYRGEIAAGLLPAIYTGEWRILGSDALAWAEVRAAKRNGRRGRPVATHPPRSAQAQC